MRDGILSRIGMWLLTWGIALFAPLLLLDRMLEEAAEAKHRTRIEEARERASTAMTTLEEHLDRPHLFAEALNRFLQRWPTFSSPDQSGPPASGVDLKAARAFTAAFRRRFSPSSALYWFDGSGSWIPVDATTPPEGKRVWQAIFRVADQPREASSMDRRLVENYLQSRLGPLAKPSLIEKLERQPLEILINGKLHFAAFLRLPRSSSATSSPGSILVIIPLFDARPGWELRLAAKRLSRPNLAVGGIWLSSNRTVGKWPLDPGMLHGLSNSFRNGEQVVEYRDHLFLTRSATRDSDLLLSIAVTLDSVSSGYSQETFILIRQWNVLLMVFSGLFIFAFAVRGWHPTLSLSVKTALGTALLAGLPLIAMLLIGVRHLSQLEQNRLNAAKQHILDRLDRFEMEVAEAQIEARALVRHLTTSPLFVIGRDQRQMRKDLAGLIPDFGLKRVFLWHQNGSTIRWGWSSRDDKRLIGLQLEFIRESLRRLNLAGKDQIELPLGVSSDTALIFRSVGMDGSLNSMKGLEGMNRLQRLEALQFGTSGWYFYQDFVTDPVTKRCVGYFNLIFDRLKVLKWLTRRALENLPRDEIRISWKPDDYRDTSRESFASRLIGQSKRNNGQIQEIQETPHGKRVGISRPSKGFPIFAASMIHLDQDDLQHQQAMQWLVAMLCLAIGGACLAAWLTKRFLLEPVQELNQALLAVSTGEYARLDGIEPGDELGQLAERYQQMVLGLEEKARMSRFLRSELTDSAKSVHHGGHRIERRDAVLLFAGLRDFTSFEGRVPPETAMDLMNRFLGTIEEQIRSHGGEIDKFIGDTAMAVFLLPRAEDPTPAPGRPSHEHPARRAIAAALDICRTFEGAGEARLPLSFGIGLAAGSVVTGPIGSERRRLDFTVIGDPVNLAARLEKLAGRPGMPAILVDQSVRIENSGEWNEVPISTVRGKTDEIRVFTPRLRGGNRDE